MKAKRAIAWAAQLADGTAMPPAFSELIGAEAFSPLAGSPVRLVQGEDGALPDDGVLVGVDRAGVLPPFDPARFDALVTTRADAPAPWVSAKPARLEAALAVLAGQRGLIDMAMARIAASYAAALDPRTPLAGSLRVI